MSASDSSDPVSKKLDALLQQLEADRLKLYDMIDSPSGTIRDIDHQQRAHHLAITRLEQGRTHHLGDIDHDALADACLRAAERMLPSPRWHSHCSSASSVVDMHTADKNAPVVPRPMVDGHYTGRGGVP